MTEGAAVPSALAALPRPPSFGRRALRALGALIALLTTTGWPRESVADPVLPAPIWSGPTALTVARGRLEVGVLSEGAWGVTDRLELRLHPVFFWALPHLEAKVRLADAEPLHLSTVIRVSHPTPFLSLIAREGSGGLLPPDERSPLALIVEGDLVGSARWARDHFVTARVGIALGLSGKSDQPLLDFPFLYQRLAPLHAPAVPRATATASGGVGWGLGYELELRHYWLPLDDYDLFQVTEYRALLQLDLSSDHRVEVGGRLASAHLPVGRRWHFLPQLDYRIAF